MFSSLGINFRSLGHLVPQATVNLTHLLSKKARKQHNTLALVFNWYELCIFVVKYRVIEK